MSVERRVRLQPGPESFQLWCDPAPSVEGIGFLPVTEVNLLASCLDGAGRKWRSRNGFLVSAATTFSTSLCAGMGEDYYGIAVEGPIYSMICEEGTGYDFALPSDGRLNFQFTLIDGGEEFWSGEAIRSSSGEQRTLPGPIALWFLHNGTTGAEHGANLLKSLGYEVHSRLVSPDQPDLSALLQEMKESVGRETPVHLVASGRASEAALELAQRVSGLSSVNIFSGSGLRFSPWIIDGQELPHVTCDHSSLQPKGRSVLFTRQVYAEAVADRANRDRGRIEVEKIACPLYLYSGSDDQIWPSAAFSELVAQRRTQYGQGADTVHLTFPSVGYDLGPELGLPGLPTTERTISHTTGFRLALGGKMGRQSRARRECWEKLIQVLGR